LGLNARGPQDENSARAPAVIKAARILGELAQHPDAMSATHRSVAKYGMLTCSLQPVTFARSASSESGTRPNGPEDSFTLCVPQE